MTLIFSPPSSVEERHPWLSGCSAGHRTGCFDYGELVGDLGGDQDPAGDRWVGIRRRQVREAVRRSHRRLVDTVADARAIAARDVEREIRIERAVVERPATAGRVGAALQQR